MIVRITLLWIMTLSLVGCATIDGPPNPNDPLESFNRASYAFNNAFDRYAYKPVSKLYYYVTPSFVDKGVTNFFSNIDDVIVVANDLLQGKFVQSTRDFSRFAINSTIGIFGFFDVATHVGLEKNYEDFGQTLGHWGVESGPYIVIPFLGPSSLRDSAGLVTDTVYLDPLNSELSGDKQIDTYVLKYVDKRADLLRVSNILETAAPDPYAFLRDSYLQQRQHLVYDGNPPVTQTDKDLFEDDLFKDDIIRK